MTAPSGDGSFELLETLLFEPGRGIYLVDRHLARLLVSAATLGFRVDAAAVTARLDAAVAGVDTPLRLRLTVGRDGDVAVQTTSMAGAPPAWAAILAPTPVDSGDLLLRHKTTRRQVYDDALAAARAAGVDEVVLHNERGECTECAVGNLVVELDGALWTPPVDCGLLPGTFRAELLSRGEVAERVLSPDQVVTADRVWLINSVRRWLRLKVRGGGGGRTDQGETACTA